MGQQHGNLQYQTWLKKYRSRWIKENHTKNIDDYIIKHELEPKYLHLIKKKYSSLTKLKQSRFYTKRERLYNLPSPLNHLDWRTIFDTLFVWTNNKTKYVVRGGTGSSGKREDNSRFIYAFLTVPGYDIGSNYHLEANDQKQCLNQTSLIKWEDFNKLNKITIE